jgi:hypothetical protein
MAQQKDEGELAVQAPVLVVQDKCRIQPFDQARARHQPWPDGGDIEFGFQEGDGHFALPDGAL